MYCLLNIYLNEILCYDYFTVSVSQRIFNFLFLSYSQIDISLLAKLTDVPRTEYSLLDPAEPTTPANTTPVVIPI